MIEIRYERSCAGCELTLTGHAGFREIGKDIVCAGVSAITYALLGYLEQLEQAQAIPVIKPTVSKGYVHVCCKKTDSALAAFEMAACGYGQIAANYPDCVELTIVQ